MRPQFIHADSVRPAAVAGLFYPGNAHDLQVTVDYLLEDAATEKKPPKAMIVPHAGYVYSGPVAASAYASLKNRKSPIERVVLVGPDHRVGFLGIAAPSSREFETPLGIIPIDREAIDALGGLVSIFDTAHAREHSLEVHLPFLQMTLGQFKLVPLVISSASQQEVAQVLEKLWGGDETLIIVSSDLSHYHDYKTAAKIDSETTAAIERLDGEAITSDEACGFLGIRGLLQVAREKGLKEETLDVRNSGDTTGPKNQVVGYGAYVFRRTG